MEKSQPPSRSASVRSANTTTCLVTTWIHVWTFASPVCLLTHFVLRSTITKWVTRRSLPFFPPSLPGSSRWDCFRHYRGVCHILKKGIVNVYTWSQRELLITASYCTGYYHIQAHFKSQYTSESFGQYKSSQNPPSFTYHLYKKWSNEDYLIQSKLCPYECLYILECWWNMQCILLLKKRELRWMWHFKISPTLFFTSYPIPIQIKMI